MSLLFPDSALPNGLSLPMGPPYAPAHQGTRSGQIFAPHQANRGARSQDRTPRWPESEHALPLTLQSRHPRCAPLGGLALASQVSRPIRTPPPTRDCISLATTAQSLCAHAQNSRLIYLSNFAFPKNISIFDSNWLAFGLLVPHPRQNAVVYDASQQPSPRRTHKTQP